MSRARMAVLLLLLGAGVTRAEDAPPPIRVRVTTFAGAPVVGARLAVRRTTWRPARDTWRQPPEMTLEERWRETPAGADDTVMAAATTGDGGWTQLESLPAGAFDVTAQSAGCAVRSAQVLVPRVQGAPPPTILLDAGHVVEGRVVTEAGDAIADALVAAIYLSAGTARWDDNERPLLARTDAKGRFRIEGVPAGTVTLGASPRNAWKWDETVVEIPRSKPVEIVVPRHRIDAIVRDRRTGNPVAGAQVLLASGPRPSSLGLATTDADGRLQLDSTDPRLGDAEIRAPGYLPRLLLPARADLGAGEPIDLTAIPSVHVRGTVCDTTGLPASAFVTATWLNGFDLATATTRSAADGTFDLEVCEGLVHFAAARPCCPWSGQAPADLDVLLATGKDGDEGLFEIPAGGRNWIPLEVEPNPDAGCVAGRVVTADGAPVARRVDSDGLARHSFRTVETLSDGTFLLEGVDAGPTAIRLYFSLESTSVRVTAGTTTSCGDIVVASERARVVGHVSGLRENAGAHVIDWNTGRRHPVHAGGKFAFPAAVCAGAVAIEVETTDGWTAGAEGAAEPGGVVKLGEIVLKDCNRSFRVVAEGDAAPIPGAAAALYLPRPGPYPVYFAEEPDDLPWRADEGGQVRIVVPRSTAWGVQVRAPGFTGVNLRASELREQIVLKPTIVVAGRVRYGAGGPAAGVRVRLSSSSPLAPHDKLEVITDANGRFRIEGVMAFPHDILVEGVEGGPSIAGTYAQNVALPRKKLDLVVGTLRTIEGRVVDPQGRPVRNTRLRAGEYVTRTDGQGAFRLHGVWAGKYDLQIERDGFWVDTNPKGVVAGTKDAVLRAEIGLRITGKVVDPSGKPCPGWLVTAQRNGSFAPRARTDADGKFVIQGLDGGAWDLVLGLHRDRRPPSGRRVRAGTEDIVLVLELEREAR